MTFTGALLMRLDGNYIARHVEGGTGRMCQSAQLQECVDWQHDRLVRTAGFCKKPPFAVLPWGSPQKN